MTTARGRTAPRTRIVVDGNSVHAVDGISLAAVLVGERRWSLRRNPVGDDPRGPFCGMGVCFECEVTVDGRPGVRACITKIYDGMRVETAVEEEAPHDR
ncbi:(2Fe-2S)-binding protein [Streptosporangium sp. NBC_01756]|uniref:(2Fe-2S)-binding protein n=1 Tax=Streptosporangium sp. NBC_01756 TaxID=2975950 RepID=UPI002DD95426|nr:(2Fe-2S)-binding protein [Streptosporangium sp. NBC_01756]WSC84622.1 (2Fe-2S)-binding protein [Streptosporangium sp. NBC_01756]